MFSPAFLPGVLILISASGRRKRRTSEKNGRAAKPGEELRF